MTRQIKVGNVLLGGGAPVTVQSMTNTKELHSTIEQINALKAMGCDIVRMAVPDMDRVKDIYEIKKQIDIPLVADIHFDYRLAIESAAAGADKIRINPGNIGSNDRVRAVAEACRLHNIPIRIGVNGGSLSKEILSRYSGPTAEALVASALEEIAVLENFDFYDICVSLKSSDVLTMVKAYRLMSQRSDCPLHLGVTEAGTEYSGTLRSAMGIGALLVDGIGDTIRVSLTADPVKEVKAGVEILKAVGLRQGVKLISCPTCGRTKVDIISLAEELEQKLAIIKKPVTVAVMGCEVNGPGEAKEADIGVACGIDCGVIFADGKIIRKVKYEEIISEIMRLIDERFT